MDVVGWRCFMEGMMSKEAAIIHLEWMSVGGSALSINDWTKELTVKLLEVTHSQ